MNQFTKLALLTAVVFNTASAYALSYEKKSVNDNWSNKSSDLVWKNGTDELCWRNRQWTPATANALCDGAIARPVAVAPPAPPVEAPAPVAPPPPPPAPVVTTEKITLSADALFDFDKAVLKPTGMTKLNELAEKTKDLTLTLVVATGHTDSVGNAAYNQKLSLHRAEAVKSYLVKKGFSAENITAEGKGETLPIASNKTSAGRAQNRRVEVEVKGTRSVVQ
ncbi:MAG: OmpA family protein [Ottowia sp.]|nr:OmpA family protein [Ottowia sp.]